MPELVAMPTITALYAGILGLMAFVISAAAGRLRGGENGVALGDGGRTDLRVAMRRHANFVETVPLLLILMALLEMNRTPGNVIHGLGVAVVVFRACHAFGMKGDGSNNLLRTIGAGGTAITTIVASIWAITTF